MSIETDAEFEALFKKALPEVPVEPVVPQKRQVGPEGSIGALITIVGEAPGANEDIIGKPFVGSAGGLLEQCMHQAGIARSECYLTNVVKERPAGNNIETFYNKKGFSKQGMMYVQALKEELKGVNSNVIVAAGNTALAALTGKLSVAKYRGSVLECTLLPGRKVIPIIHPAAALREYLFKYQIISDLKRVRLESQFPEIRRVKRNLILNPTYPEAMSYIEKCNSYPLVSFDIEVVNQELSCFAIAVSPTEGMCIPLSYRPNGYPCNKWSESEETDIMVALTRLFGNDKLTILGQNIMFDTTFMARRFGILRKGPLHDTMVGHHITYYDFDKGLDFLCSVYENEPYYKDEGKLWKNPNISDMEFWTYCAKDATITFGCWLNIKKEMESRKTENTYDFTMKEYPVLTYMQLRGIKADREKLAKTKAQVKEKTETLQADLNRRAGQELNVQSPKQCQEYFYIKKGFKPYTSRKTGTITTDDKAMTKLERKGCREATLVKEIRGLKKLSGTYLDMEFDSDDRLRCSYNPVGTNTGRLSSSQTIFGTGTNFQNLPPEFKTFLVADEGCFLAEFDKRQAEWIEVAYLSGDASMIKVVEEGLDAHAYTAHLMFNAPMDLIKLEDKIVGKTTDDVLIKELREKGCPEIFQYNPLSSVSCRQGGKKSNHGYNYDLSPQGFADTWQVPLDDAKRCYSLYHRAYPGIHLWHKSIIDQLSKDRTLVNCFGRKRWFGDRWGDDLFKQAYAYLPQSTVADGVNDALIRIYNDQREEYMRLIDMLGQVHDSALIQYLMDRLAEFAKAAVTIKRYMEQTLTYHGRSHVIPTDLKIGLDWGTMKDVKLTNNVEEVYESTKAVLLSLRG